MADEVDMDAKEMEEGVINIAFYRKVLKQYMELNRFKTAQFWAEKVVTLSNENEDDIYQLALALYSSKEYYRAAHLIQSKNLQRNAKSCYLAASCLLEAKQFEDSMNTLSETLALIDDETNTFLSPSTPTIETSPDESDVKLLGNSLISCIHLERGRAYEAMENRELAAECFKEALRADIFCYEAFELLIQHQMLPTEKENKLLSSLPFSKHCPTQVDQDLVKYLYESKLNKYRSINTMESTAPAWLVARMENSLDQKVSVAERHFYNSNMKQCHRITNEVMTRDPYHMGCLPVHISCLVEQGYSNALFLLAHKLVEIYPESGISWFAVGCYYYIIGKNDFARKYLGKATVLDKLFGPAWLAFGHSFAADSEHDQAMAAYFKAAQIMIGCHLPLLYIGLENGLTNNTALAEKFFVQAHDVAPDDPFVLHEMGVIAFQSSLYEKARKLFEEALEKVKTNETCVIQRKWEPLLNNLGHTYRKLHLYEKSMECHMQAMVLMPSNHSTYAAIGFCEILTGQRKKSIETFHKALSIKRDDTFATTMLNYVLDLHIQESKEANDCADISLTSANDSSVKGGMSESDEAAMMLVRSSCSDAGAAGPAYCAGAGERSSNSSTFMSTEPSFVDVSNTN